MPLGTRLLRSFGSALAGKAVVILCGVGTFAILARHLGAEGLGKYRIVLTVLAFAGMAFDFGLQKITLRDISGIDADQSRIVGGAVAFRIIATAVAIVAAGAFVRVSPYDDDVLAGVFVAGIGWIAYQLSQLLLTVFQLRLAQQQAAVAEVVGAVTTLGIVFLLSLTRAGTTAMLGATASGWIVSMALSWIFAIRLLPFRPRLDLMIWRGLLIAGLPVAVSGLLSITHIRADVLLLSMLGKPSDVGIYDVSLKVYELVTSVPYMFAGLLMPLFVADRDVNGIDSSRRLTASLSIALIFITLVTIVVMVHAESISLLLAGAGFDSSGSVMRVIFISAIFATMSTLLRFAALAHHLQKSLLKSDLIAVCLALVAYYLLIPRYGIMGAAAGKLIGDIGILLAMITLVNSRLRVKVPGGFLVAIASALILWGLLELADRADIHWLVASVLAGSLVGMGTIALPLVRREIACLVDPAPPPGKLDT